MICINKYFSNILTNEKKKEVCKEYIIPNKFDLNLIKDEFHYITNIEARVYYEDCNNINSVFINNIKIEIGNQIFYQRGKNEILCFEDEDEYMKYEIQFPTSRFFTKENHFLFLSNVFSFYKIKIQGYIFEDIDLLINVPKQPNRTPFYTIIFDHHPNYYIEGKFYCNSNYDRCSISYIKYCPNWFQENYEICDYKLPDFEDYKTNSKEYILQDNNNEKYILFFINKPIQINPLRILVSRSLCKLFYTHMKNTYKTYMAGAFYNIKTKYCSKIYDFQKINIKYIIEETNCLGSDGLFKIRINNKLQKFCNSNIDSNIEVNLNHLEFFLDLDNVNNEILFDNVLMSSKNDLYITLTIDKNYEKYLEILDIDLAFICIEGVTTRREFVTNEIILQIET
jgi:hypothetical protein